LDGLERNELLQRISLSLSILKEKMTVWTVASSDFPEGGRNMKAVPLKLV
jgi:hypothetical protein